MTWAAIAVAGTTATIAGVKMVSEKRKANKAEKAEAELGDQPEYKAPEEALAGLSIQQRQAYEGMPAAQQQQYIENMQSMQASGLNQMSSLQSGLMGVANANATTQQGNNDLAVLEGQAVATNTDQYVQGLDRMAGYKDLEYQTNQLQPHQQQLAYYRAQQGAALQGQNNAFNQGTQAAASGAGAYASSTQA